MFCNFPAAQWGKAEAFFRSVGRSDLASQPKRTFGYSLFLESELELHRFKQGLQDHGFGNDDCSVRRELLYSDDELRSLPFLRLSVTRAPKGFGGPWYGTQYDLSSACSLCGTGAVQISPLVLKRSEIQVPKSRRVVQTLDWELLVSVEFGAAVRKSGVTGLELRSVIASTDKMPLPWLQLIAGYTMPPMAAATGGIVLSDKLPPCPVCRRDGRYHMGSEPEQLKYRSEDVDVEALPDAVTTWECFGRSGLREPFEKSHFATPLLLVKPRVFEIFREHKVREVQFLPVEIVE